MLDYKKLGLISGIECHQQLATKKLFCSCDSKLLEEKGELELKRNLRPVASETNSFDKAALQEFKKGKDYFYEINKNNICLVELDEEPPHKINQEALDLTLEISLLTNAEIFDDVFVMRKMVIDGSNTSGFQKTCLIAQNGKLKLKNKEVGIASICLEEDAAKNLENNMKFRKYKLDRLGIPLIEFTTKPELNTPQEVKECATKIGELFRITGKAMRGLGSIRQDINISIKNGARVEIKGAQYLNIIDKYVEYEVLRQVNLLKIKDILNKTSSKDKQKFKIIDITNILKNSENKKVLEAIKKGHKALAIKLFDFNGILGFEIQPNRRVGTELSSYAKAKARVKGLFHSDELPKYNINQEIVDKIKKELNLNLKDGFIIVVEKENIAKKALKAVFDRAILLFDEIPEETRNPFEDGTSEYSRPLPGSARMYPETDILLKEITKTHLKEIEKKLPMWYKSRIDLYLKIGINKQIAEQIAKSNHARFFTRNLKTYDLKKLTSLVLNLENYDKIEKYIWILDSKINMKKYKDAIKLFKNGITTDEIKEKLKEEKLSKEMINIIDKIIFDKKEFINMKKENALNPLMGMAIKEINIKTGKKVNAKEISEYLKQKLKI